MGRGEGRVVVRYMDARDVVDELDSEQRVTIRKFSTLSN